MAPGLPRVPGKVQLVFCHPDYFAVVLDSCCGRVGQRGWQALLSQALREIVQILWNDVVTGQPISLICVQ